VFTNQLQRKLTRRCSEVATSTKHYSDSGFLIIQVAKTFSTDLGFVQKLTLILAAADQQFLDRP